MGLFTPSYLKEGKGVRKDEPPKKGILRFFEIVARDSGDLVKLNLLFFISCIPIITIGPAIVAMSAVVVKRVRNIPCYAFHEYKKAFKENLKRSFPAGLLVMVFVVMSLFAAWYYNSAYNQSQDLMYLVLAVITLFLSGLISAGSCYLFTMIAVVDLPLKLQLKNAVLLTFGFLPRTALFFIISLVLWAAAVLFLPWTLLVFVFVFFSFVNLIINMNVWNVLEKVFVIGLGSNDESDEDDEETDNLSEQQDAK